MEECTVQQCAAQFSFLQCSVFQCGSDLEGCSAENEAGEKCLNRQGKGSAMARVVPNKQQGKGSAKQAGQEGSSHPKFMLRRFRGEPAPYPHQRY